MTQAAIIAGVLVLSWLAWRLHSYWITFGRRDFESLTGIYTEDDDG